MRNPAVPEPSTARRVAEALLCQPIHAVERIMVGTQNYVYSVGAEEGRFVLRMTTPEWVESYVSALQLQRQLAPLGIPVVPFIHHDVTFQYSPFPALVMPHVAGTDLIRAYPHLSAPQKRALGDEMARIHAGTAALPHGRGYGFARANDTPPYASWRDFLLARWEWFTTVLKDDPYLDSGVLRRGGAIIDRILAEGTEIRPTPFIWDLAEKNLLVSQGEVTGIVDVDNLCYGDPLWTVGLVYAAFDQEGWDDIYAQSWLAHHPDTDDVRRRLQCYRLFWLVNALRSASTPRVNGNAPVDRRERQRQLIALAVDRGVW